MAVPVDLDDLAGVDLCPGFAPVGLLVRPSATARGCAPAPCCAAARAEADRRWPDRSRVSDGICASSSHSQQNPSSDHEPGPDGLAEAIDISHDPAHGVNTYSLFDRLREECQAGRVDKVKYLISNRRICSTIAGWTWRYYGGSNAHDHHGHISFVHDRIGDRSDLFGFLDPVADRFTAEEREALARWRLDSQATVAALG